VVISVKSFGSRKDPNRKKHIRQFPELKNITRTVYIIGTKAINAPLAFSFFLLFFPAAPQLDC